MPRPCRPACPFANRYKELCSRTALFVPRKIFSKVSSEILVVVLVLILGLILVLLVLALILVLIFALILVLILVLILILILVIHRFTSFHFSEKAVLIKRVQGYYFFF